MKARTGTSFGFLALRTVTAETVKRRFLISYEMRGLALLMALIAATMARIPHADPAYVWIGSERSSP